MINNFISAIFAMFYWKRIDSKSFKSVLHASWIRTFIYGFLAFIFSAYLYKTYQITTIYNTIQIDGIRQSYDSIGNVIDTVKSITIVHRLANNSMQQDRLDGGGIRKISGDKDWDSKLNLYGGIFATVQTVTHPYEIKAGNNPHWNNKVLSGFYENIDLINIPRNNVDHVYDFSYTATNPPSVIPFFPKIRLHHSLKSVDDTVFTTIYFGNTKNNPDFDLILIGDRSGWHENEDRRDNQYPDNLKNGIIANQIIGTNGIRRVKEDLCKLEFIASCNFVNSLGFFTAADISQYIYALSLSSDCPVKDMYVDYDIPIEIPQQEHMQIGMRGFSMDSVLIKDILREPHVFNIKFPSLANLQLIRSLILTTLVTALISLFCRNLYLLIRKWAYRRRKKNWIPVGVARQLSKKTKEKIRHGERVFKFVLYAMSLCFFAAIFVAVIIVIQNSSILIDFKFWDYIYYLPIILLLISSIIIYLSYNKIRKPLNLALSGAEEDDTQDNTDKTPFIFLHDRDENAEYDKLVEDLLKESNEYFSSDNEDNGLTPETPDEGK